jgi:hypothetical protein
MTLTHETRWQVQYTLDGEQWLTWLDDGFIPRVFDNPADAWKHWNSPGRPLVPRDGLLGVRLTPALDRTSSGA